MVTLHEVITFLVSMQISISSLQTHNVNRCGRSRHLARKLSLRRKRSSPNVFEMAATETITSIILIKLIRVSLGTVRHPRRFKIGRASCRERVERSVGAGSGRKNKDAEGAGDRGRVVATGRGVGGRYVVFFSSRRRHTRSVSAFLLNRSSDLARKLSLRRKRSSPNVFEMAATETITSIILIKLIRVSLGTVRHPRRF